ncbi:MAG: HD domain-containing protein [Bacteroidetes bacterium]|nr:HD domain-containing protein [Bacteroidota bacterium]
MLNQQKLISLSTGSKVNHYLLVVACDVKTAKNNRSYLNLELRDESQQLNCKMWDGFEVIAKEIDKGSIVKVDGIIEEFNNQQQIRINRIRASVEKDNVTAEDFLAKSSRNLDEMLSELSNRIELISNKFLKTLLNNILAGNNLKKYSNVPAGKSWHHSYLHGLLEHTLEIIRICDLMSDIHSEIDRDLLISGAALHDFGKIEELEFETGFDYTDKGRLLGHIVIASMIVNNEADKIPNFPEALKTELLHLILSHQGKLEYASPVEPKTLEAIVLYHADELSAKSNAYKYAILSEKNGQNRWTKFLHLAGTSLYIPIDENGTNQTTLFDK